MQHTIHDSSHSMDFTSSPRVAWNQNELRNIWKWQLIIKLISWSRWTLAHSFGFYVDRDWLNFTVLYWNYFILHISEKSGWKLFKKYLLTATNIEAWKAEIFIIQSTTYNTTSTRRNPIWIHFIEMENCPGLRVMNCNWRRMDLLNDW